MISGLSHLRSSGGLVPALPSSILEPLWVQLYDTVDELRQAVASFVDRYNSSWLIQRHGHHTPKEAYQAAQSASAA